MLEVLVGNQIRREPDFDIGKCRAPRHVIGSLELVPYSLGTKVTRKEVENYA